MIKQVILIEDDDAMRLSLTQTLDLEEITVIAANSLMQAKRNIRANFSGVIISDIRMPTNDGFDVLAYVKSVDNELPTIMLTGEADVPMALQAIKSGAYDFLEKPCPRDKLMDTIHRAFEYRNIILQKRKLEREIQRNDPAVLNFPGQSKPSKNLQNLLRKLGSISSHVLISGEEGVRKKLAAFTLHTLGRESAIFRTHNFSSSSNSLNEILQTKDIINLSIQSLHLATVRDHEILKNILINNQNIRILISSRLPFSKLIEDVKIKKLIEIIDPIELSIPNLHSRRKDLPMLFEQVLREEVRHLNLDMPNIPQTIYAEIMSKSWTGNIPQLRKFARKFLLNIDLSYPKEDETLADQLYNFEALVLCETLRKTNGKATLASTKLGLPRKTFYDRLARYNIKPKDFR
ncbi:response regulator [Amylibacter sp.]|nr:response regulator [Amylibacter sp.]